MGRCGNLKKPLICLKKTKIESFSITVFQLNLLPLMEKGLFLPGFETKSGVEGRGRIFLYVPMKQRVSIFYFATDPNVSTIWTAREVYVSSII